MARDRSEYEGQPLTKREMEVLRYMREGLENEEIARAMWVSESTLSHHIGMVYAKLGVHDRAHALLYALSHGMIDPPDRAA
jgi:DNA-binding CsgD family transcriptional regulator